MQRNALCIPTLIIFLSISLAGCGQQARTASEQKPPPIATATDEQPTHEGSEQQAPPANDHLAQALMFAPEGTTQVSFVDWAWIKRWKGATALNSTHSTEERMEFFQDLGLDQP